MIPYGAKLCSLITHFSSVKLRCRWHENNAAIFKDYLVNVYVQSEVAINVLSATLKIREWCKLQLWLPHKCKYYGGMTDTMNKSKAVPDAKLTPGVTHALQNEIMKTTC